MLYYVPAAAKLMFLLFGPLALLHLFYRRPKGQSDYVVSLRTELRKTILVKKVRVDNEDPSTTSSSGGSEAKQFARFRQLVKQLPSEEIVQVNLAAVAYGLSVSNRNFCCHILIKDFCGCTFTRVRPADFFRYSLMYHRLVLL